MSEIEAVQRILRQVESDLNRGIEIRFEDDRWMWHPSAGDVIDAVRCAIADPSVQIPSYRGHLEPLQ